MKQKPVVLEIDTSVMKEVSVGLVIDGKTHKKRLVSDTSRAQALLPLIKKMLKETNLTLADIREISVVQGPGSFTGLRVGISVANMLSVLLGIPINGKKTLATPTYS